MPNDLKGFVLGVEEFELLVAIEHATHAFDERRRRYKSPLLQQVEHVVPRPVSHVFLDIPREGVGIVGEEEMRVVDDVAVAGILERLRLSTNEVEEVGGRVDAHALFRDVGIEPQDQALVFAGLHAGML